MTSSDGHAANHATATAARRDDLVTSRCQPLAFARAWAAGVFMVVALVPACVRPPASRPAAQSSLDALAYIEGCWRYWSVDWGIYVCWRREADAWVGTYASMGPMGPNESLELRIARGAETLELSVGHRRGKRTFAMTSFAADHVEFGAEWGFWRGDETLHVRTHMVDFRYPMERVTPSPSR